MIPYGQLWSAYVTNRNQFNTSHINPPPYPSAPCPFSLPYMAPPLLLSHLHRWSRIDTTTCAQEPSTEACLRWDELWMSKFRENSTLTTEGYLTRMQQYLFLFKAMERFEGSKGPLLEKDLGKHRVHRAYVATSEERTPQRELTARMLELLVSHHHICTYFTLLT